MTLWNGRRGLPQQKRGLNRGSKIILQKRGKSVIKYLECTFRYVDVSSSNDWKYSVCINKGTPGNEDQSSDGQRFMWMTVSSGVRCLKAINFENKHYVIQYICQYDIYFTNGAGGWLYIFCCWQIENYIIFHSFNVYTWTKMYNSLNAMFNDVIFWFRPCMSSHVNCLQWWFRTDSSTKSSTILFIIQMFIWFTNWI